MGMARSRGALPLTFCYRSRSGAAGIWYPTAPEWRGGGRAVGRGVVVVDWGRGAHVVAPNPPVCFSAVEPGSWWRDRAETLIGAMMKGGLVAVAADHNGSFALWPSVGREGDLHESLLLLGQGQKVSGFTHNPQLWDAADMWYWQCAISGTATPTCIGGGPLKYSGFAPPEAEWSAEGPTYRVDSLPAPEGEEEGGGKTVVHVSFPGGGYRRVAAPASWAAPEVFGATEEGALEGPQPLEGSLNDLPAEIVDMFEDPE